MTATLNNLSLTREGSVVSDVIYSENIISYSPDYDLANDLYSTSVQTTDKINTVYVQCI